MPRKYLVKLIWKIENFELTQHAIGHFMDAIDLSVV